MNFTLTGIFLIIFFVFANLSGCSTTELVPSPIPSPPIYTQVPHPVGMDIGDLTAIFNDEKAPQDKNFAKNCDADFRKLEGKTTSRDEVLEGLRELVKLDPVIYHWCFYAKVLELENDLKGGKFVDERQKIILNYFAFLAPLARTYASEFRDSRYLRMAISRYQKWSEWIFYRKVELTPTGTSELVKASNPFGLWRDTLETVSVLEKYSILKAPAIAPVPTAEIIPENSVSAGSSVKKEGPVLPATASLGDSDSVSDKKSATSLADGVEGTAVSDLPTEGALTSP